MPSFRPSQAHAVRAGHGWVSLGSHEMTAGLAECASYWATVATRREPQLVTGCAGDERKTMLQLSGLHNEIDWQESG